MERKGASGGGASSKKADEGLKMNHLKAILKDQEEGEYPSF